MYDLNKIAECINDLTKINQEDLDVFKNLADEHSYSPVFSILYLKALSKFNPLVFENVLKDYAYIIPSRKKLYELIHEAKLEQETIQEDQKQEKESITSNESDQDVANFETKELEKEEETFDSNEEITSDAVVNKSLPLKKEELPEEETKSIEPESDNALHLEPEQQQEETKRDEKEIKKHQPTDYDALERGILAHAVGASISLEVEEIFKQEQLERAANVSKEEDNTDQEEERNVDYSQTRSFTEWLTLSSDEKEKKETNQLKKEEKKKKSQLEYFEVKEPRIFFSASQKAKESLDYSNIPITETLAKIYDAQGNFPRALEAYEQLILKIPEKKVFFALQIEKLKKKINK